MIFEDHAKLEWRAPAIDGRVCRFWRQIVLNTPRVWAYLEISHVKQPSISSLRSWLDRSHAAPLHIRVDRDLIFDHGITSYDILSENHTRIASLRMGVGHLSFFEERHFPSMRLLHVTHWYWRNPSLPPVRWRPMPALRSLCLGPANDFVVPLDRLPPLETLILYTDKCTSLSRASPSLVALLLHSVSLGDAISGSLDFPSLTHLGLFGVEGLKPNISTPYLVTYHESGWTVMESFSAPIPSLAEYGICTMESHCPSLTEWHRSFPNIKRLVTRTNPSVLIALLHSLSGQPHSLPALQIISASSASWTYGGGFPKKAQETMENLIQVRSKACHKDIALYIEPEEHLPFLIRFACVSHCIIR
jgi:hypothetical protein